MTNRIIREEECAAEKAPATNVKDARSETYLITCN